MSRDPLVVGRVVGDVLDPFTRTTALKVAYGSKDVSNGKAFKPSQVCNQPTVEVGGNDLRTFYTLVMVDPDAPSPSDPTLREYLHCLGEISVDILPGVKLPSLYEGTRTKEVKFKPGGLSATMKLIIGLVIDIPGTTEATYGQEVMCYENPRPSLGIHRIVFVLFQQLGRQTVYAPGWRQNFNTRDFTELYNLGSPVAAVYYNCQRESGSGGRRMYL